MYMTVTHAAISMGFSLRHFRRLMLDTPIPFVQFGRKQFILTSVLEALREKLQRAA